MKFLVLSDLHLNESRMDLRLGDADVVLVVGDTSYTDEYWYWLLERLEGRKAIIVPGNHDYDGWDITTRDQQIRDICAEFDSVYFLNNESIVLDGVKFIGTCLWTDFSIEEPVISQAECMQWASQIAHIKTIKKNGKSLTPKDILELHRESVDFLKYELMTNRENIPTIVMTHFAPHKNSVPPLYQISNNSYHAVDLEHLIGFSDYWLHGHIHSSSDYTLHDTRIIANPRGYSKTFDIAQNVSFEPSLTIEPLKCRP